MNETLCDASGADASIHDRCTQILRLEEEFWWSWCLWVVRNAVMWGNNFTSWNFSLCRNSFKWDKEMLEVSDERDPSDGQAIVSMQKSMIFVCKWYHIIMDWMVISFLTRLSSAEWYDARYKNASDWKIHKHNDELTF